MNCKFCGAECANIGELNKHKPTCPNRPVDKQTETPDCSHFVYDFSPAQHKLMQLYWGRDYTDPLKEHFEALIADMLKPIEEEVEPEAPKDTLIPASLMSTEIISILPKKSTLRFEVDGWLDEEGNLHAESARWQRRRRAH